MKLLTSQIQNQLKDKNSVIAPLLRNGCIFRFSQSSKMTTQEQNVTSFDYNWPISIHVVCLFSKFHTRKLIFILITLKGLRYTLSKSGKWVTKVGKIMRFPRNKSHIWIIVLQRNSLSAGGFICTRKTCTSTRKTPSKPEFLGVL